MRGAAAIVGVADAVSPTGELDGSVRALEVRMIREALDDAGLALADVDGLFCSTSPGWAPTMELAEHLGIAPTWTDTTITGGSSFEIHVEHAAAAIALGLCEVAVIVYAATPRSSFKRVAPASPAARPARGSPPPPSGSWPTGCACRWGPTRSRPAATWPSSAPAPSSSPRSRSTPGAGRR
ncbi:MAG: hypothetical protein R2711_13820 [Acidimicrobiales bacterium]